MYQTHGISLEACRLPAHVSLKQPFDIPDIAALEGYMAELAHDIQPHEISLTRLQLVETNVAGNPTGILWLEVNETPLLRSLHDRLNRELAERYGNTPAPFDGPDYHFHITVAIGGQPLEVFRDIYRKFQDTPATLPSHVQELALFAYDKRNGEAWDWMTYKVLPLG
jgi:2'-5' RNA ligase